MIELLFQLSSCNVAVNIIPRFILLLLVIRGTILILFRWLLLLLYPISIGFFFAVVGFRFAVPMDRVVHCFYLSLEDPKRYLLLSLFPLTPMQIRWSVDRLDVQQFSINNSKIEYALFVVFIALIGLAG